MVKICKIGGRLSNVFKSSFINCHTYTIARECEIEKETNKQAGAHIHKRYLNL